MNQAVEEAPKFARRDRVIFTPSDPLLDQRTGTVIEGPFPGIFQHGFRYIVRLDRSHIDKEEHMLHEERLQAVPVYYSIEDIKKINEEKGLHFFSPGALRFFSSRILPTVHQDGKGTVLFVTSERFDYKSPRLYTVRRFDPETGNVDTEGRFQQWETAREAHKEAARLLKEGN